MFVLPGTCKEIEGDEDVQRTLKKRKKETKDTGTDPKKEEVCTLIGKLDDFGTQPLL